MTTNRLSPHRFAAVAVVGLCLALGACNGAADPAGASLEQSVAAPAQKQAQMVALAPGPTRVPSQPVASLPAEAGAVASVRGKTYVDGFRQDVALEGSPIHSVGNGITVLTRTSSQATLDEAVPLYKPSEKAIRSEIGAQFPHIAMQVVERASSNGYGPYGLALGRAGGTVHCAYMWQWIDENRLPRDANLSGPVSIRIRLCRNDTNFDAMAAMMNQLSISAGVGGSDETVAAPDLAPAKPARKIARHHTHRIVEARREPAASSMIAAPAVAPAPAPASAAPLSMDLPPQAYLGPRAGSTKSN